MVNCATHASLCDGIRAKSLFAVSLPRTASGWACRNSEIDALYHAREDEVVVASIMPIGSISASMPGYPEKVKSQANTSKRRITKTLASFAFTACCWRPVFGRLDFVFQKGRVAVFVDGCFWHGCPKHSKLPVNNRAFWRKKMAANKARDRRVNRTLRQANWRVVRIWEHELGQGGEWVERLKDKG